MVALTTAAWAVAAHAVYEAARDRGAWTSWSVPGRRRCSGFVRLGFDLRRRRTERRAPGQAGPRGTPGARPRRGARARPPRGRGGLLPLALPFARALRPRGPQARACGSFLRGDQGGGPRSASWTCAARARRSARPCWMPAAGVWRRGERGVVLRRLGYAHRRLVQPLRDDKLCPNCDLPLVLHGRSGPPRLHPLRA